MRNNNKQQQVIILKGIAQQILSMDAPTFDEINKIFNLFDIQKNDTKVTTNKNIKQRFKELFFDQIDVEKSLKYSFVNKNGEYLGSYDQETKNFWLSYDRIWSKLESEFTPNDQEISELTKGILEEHYNLKGITTSALSFFPANCIKI